MAPRPAHGRGDPLRPPLPRAELPGLARWLTVEDRGLGKGRRRALRVGGLGIVNEFNEADPALLKVLSLASAETSKNLAVIRPVMELPVALPIGEIAFESGRIPAVGLKQALVPADAKVLGTWADGKPAVTSRSGS